MFSKSSDSTEKNEMKNWHWNASIKCTGSQKCTTLTPVTIWNDPNTY
jgi:hypothetical protein